MSFKHLNQSQQHFAIDLSQRDPRVRTLLQGVATNPLYNILILLRFLLGDGLIPHHKADEVWLDFNGPLALLLGCARRLFLRYQNRLAWMPN